MGGEGEVWDEGAGRDSGGGTAGADRVALIQALDGPQRATSAAIWGLPIHELIHKRLFSA